jgi:alkylation response protein AidB-like acyl-CoA dehydrogenase
MSPTVSAESVRVLPAGGDVKIDSRPTLRRPGLGKPQTDGLLGFALTEEQEQLRGAVRKFAEAEMRPHVMEWDEGSHFPTELIPKLAAMGLLGIIFPVEYGGAGLGYVEYVIALEELARVDGSIGLIISSHTSLCTSHIYRFATEEQRRQYVVPLARGEKLGSWSLTEPEAGSDAGGTRTVAARRGGGWVLNGAKTFTTNGHYADVCVAMAATDRSKGPHGISAFILEKGMPGFRPGRKENKLGMRASDTSEVIFDDCRVPSENLIAPEGNGLIQSLQILDGGRISIGALAVGMAQGAYEAALRYAQQRRQFGKAISEFQAIQFKLADMATQVDAARLMVYRAAWLADRHQGRFTKEASMAKLFASEVAVRVAGEAVQIFGGYGFIKDYPVEKYYRDVRLCTIGEGTSEMQRLVIARQLLGKKPTQSAPEA